MELNQLGNIMPTENRDNPNQGRVYSADGISPTITNTAGGGGREPAIVEHTIVRSIGRNPDNPSDRTPGNHVEQRLEPNKDGVCDTLTTVQKDNLVLEKEIVGGIYTGVSPEYQRGALKGVSRCIKGNQHDAGVVERVKIKQATKEGYAECNIGGVADLSFPTSKTRRGRVQGNGEVAPTILAAAQNLYKIESRYRIRKLTPLECWRLMGFTDEDFRKAESVNAKTHLYAQAGKSIVKPVLEGIFSQLNIKGVKPWK